MATYTDNGTNTPNGSHKVFTYTFPALQTEDIKVALNGVAQATTKYTASLSPAQIEFNNTSIDSSVQESTGAPKTGVQVRVFRETTVGKNSGDDDPKAVFAAGSSIRAIDLNANTEQALYAIHELQNQPIKTSDVEPDAITNAKIADNSIDSEHYVDGSIDRVHLAADIVDGSKIADDSIDSEHYVDASIDEQHIANSAVTSNKIADNAVTTTEILNGAVTTDKLANLAVTEGKLATNSVGTNKIIDNSVTASKLANDSVTNAIIAADAIDSVHYVDGSIDTQHIADGQITEPKLAVNSVNAGKIVDGTITTNKIANDAVTIDKIADAAIVTNSEQASHSVNDNTFFTTAAAEARYFNASTGETIKNGDTFPDNDTTIATTAAINDRIIDLVDDVGGFVPIANELSFPNANPDVNNGTGTLVSIKALSQAYTPNGSGQFTINQGTVGNSEVIIIGAPANDTIAASYGMIVETTTTLNTYTFHRLVPKATEVSTVSGSISNVNTVAGSISNVNTVASDISNINAVAADATDIGAVAAKATEIGRLGTADAVADMAILGTADVVADLNTLGTADVVADMNMLATSDVVADMNMLAVSDVISDMNDLATSGNITAMSTCSTNIASINNCSTNISSANTFGDQYQVASNNPTTDGGGNALAAGDLYFNTSANELKVYNGSSWQGGVTASGSFAATTGNTFTGDNRYNDGVKALFGTGSDMEIFHDGSNSRIHSASHNLNIRTPRFGAFNGAGNEYMILATEDGSVDLYYNNSKKFETTSGGAKVTGNFISTGDIVLDSDSNKLKLGSGDDLQIYHDGNHSRIKNSTGALSIQADDINVNNAASNEQLATFTANGAVELFYDHSKKFETTSSGVTVTGEVTSNTLQLSSNAPRIIFTDLNNNPDFEISGNSGALTFIDSTNGANRLIIQSDGTVDVQGNLDANGGLDVTGNITVTGTVDGKDVSTLIANIVEDTSPQLGGALDTNGKNINFGDSTGGSADDRLVMGNGQDMAIYHDPSIGNLVKISSGDFLIRHYDEEMIVAKPNGSVELYYDNSKKLNTEAGGITVSGTVWTDAVQLNDNEKYYAGTSQDLQIYHDGNNTILENNTGYLALRNSSSNSNTVYIRGKGDEDGIRVIGDGAVELYHNGNKKFSTHQYGVDIDGNVYIGDSGEGKLLIGDGDDLQIFHDGSHSTIDNNTGTLYLKTATNLSFMTNHSEDAIACIANGGVSLYYDNSNKFNTNSGGVAVHGDISLGTDNYKIKFGTSEDLQIYHDGSNSHLAETGTGELRISGNSNIRMMKTTAETIANFTPDAAVELYYDNSKKLATVSNGIQVAGIVEAMSGYDLEFNTASNTQIRFRSNGTIRFSLNTSGHLEPYVNNTYDLGTSSKRFRNIYTNDLNLSNEGSSNDVDGTWGNWTIQEGESDLFLKNNRSGKKYKFNLTEVS